MTKSTAGNPNEGQDGEIHISKSVVVFLSALPFVLLLAGIVFSLNYTASDHTGGFFKQFLKASQAANPIESSSPYRDDGSFVYVANPETIVRSAMAGRIEKIGIRERTGTHFLELAATNADGKSVLVEYFGLAPTVSVGEKVPCGAKIGIADRVLQVRFTVNGEVKHPPESLPTVPRREIDAARAKETKGDDVHT